MFFVFRWATTLGSHGRLWFTLLSDTLNFGISDGRERAIVQNRPDRLCAKVQISLCCLEISVASHANATVFLIDDCHDDQTE
jgi:hypothetical protein